MNYKTHIFLYTGLSIVVGAIWFYGASWVRNDTSDNKKKEKEKEKEKASEESELEGESKTTLEIHKHKDEPKDIKLSTDVQLVLSTSPSFHSADVLENSTDVAMNTPILILPSPSTPEWSNVSTPRFYDDDKREKEKKKEKDTLSNSNSGLLQNCIVFMTKFTNHKTP